MEWELAIQYTSLAHATATLIIFNESRKKEKY